MMMMIELVNVQDNGMEIWRGRKGRKGQSNRSNNESNGFTGRRKRAGFEIRRGRIVWRGTASSVKDSPVVELDQWN